MEALTHLPGLDKQDATRTQPDVLRHTFGFLVTTFNDYWCPLLSPSLSVELSDRLSIDPNPDERKKMVLDMFEKFEKESGGKFDRNAWPEFDKEKYSDAMGRLYMGCLTVLDGKKRVELFGGEGWEFGGEVEAVARGIMEDKA
jgi:hypothetical protein